MPLGRSPSSWGGHVRWLRRLGSSCEALWSKVVESSEGAGLSENVLRWPSVVRVRPRSQGERHLGVGGIRRR
eukprot:7835889-Heterocapsa_arctica.AAC.1